MDAKKFPDRAFRHLVLMPFIWANLFTILAADVVLEVYHRICFPLFDLPYVSRSRYIRIDRHRLKYLTWSEKIGCAYCGYANGWIHYAAAIAANTEQYWCGIKHEKKKGVYTPKHQETFIEYGDESAYRQIHSSGT